MLYLRKASAELEKEVSRRLPEKPILEKSGLLRKSN